VMPTCVSWDWEGRGIIIGWGIAAVELWDVERGVATTKLLCDASGTASKEPKLIKILASQLK
jgi:hypothetical protein